jgi:hypothetical protein
MGDEILIQLRTLFFTLWDQCTESPEYDKKAWNAFRDYLSKHYGIVL